MLRHTVYAYGIDTYDAQPNLRFCSNDATAFAETMQGFGASIADVKTTKSGSSTSAVQRADIESALEQIADSDALPSDAVVLFFAGHGFEAGGRDYLCATDTRGADTAIETDRIIAALRASRAGLGIVVLDACRSDVTAASRGVGGFGERTRDYAKKQGVVTFFGCDAGQVCRESADLGDNGHGIFTYALLSLLRESRRLVPVFARKELQDLMYAQCERLGLPPQDPDIAVSKLDVVPQDLLTGNLVELAPRPRRMVIIAGPPHAGKSTIASRVAAKIGFVPLEMSSYAYDRYLEWRAQGGYLGTIQQFMEDVVWRSREYDIIARDLLESDPGGVHELVVTGPRRTEEIEAFQAAGFGLEIRYVYADSRTRYTRYLDAERIAMPDLGLGIEDFVRRDLTESAWGLASIGRMDVCDIVVNDQAAEPASVADAIVERAQRRWGTLT